MVSYKCNQCNKIFKQKIDYTRHIKRKTPCKTYDDNGHNKDKTIAIELKTTEKVPRATAKELKAITTTTTATEVYKKSNRECIHCKKMFARPYNLTVHLAKCKIKSEKDQEKEDIMTVLIKEKEDLKALLMKEKEEGRKQIEEIKAQMYRMEKMMKIRHDAVNIQNNTHLNSNSNNNNSNNTINNTQNNNTVNQINIIAYGKEDLSHIKEIDYKRILNKGFKSIPAFVESVHFNKDKPENHNVYISNMRDKYALVYNGKEWQLQERDDVLQDMVDNKGEILQQKFNEMVDGLDEFTVRKFGRFLEQRDENEVMDRIKDDLKMLLYNKRKVVDGDKTIEYK
jgi:uncharacterized C2H2 Zn-finger protein